MNPMTCLNKALNLHSKKIIQNNCLMKYSLLVILILSSFTMIAQKDVIYPEIGKASIRKCTIIKVTDGNMVHYQKDSISSIIKAVSIRRDGNYIKLSSEVFDLSKNQFAYYKGKSYDYYVNEHVKVIKNRNLGIGLTFCGIGAGLIGGLTMNNGGNSTKTKRALAALFIGGGIITNIGIIVWVSEGSHAANISKAMKKAKKNANLSLGITNNGVGLLLSFNN